MVSHMQQPVVVVVGGGQWHSLKSSGRHTVPNRKPDTNIFFQQQEATNAAQFLHHEPGGQRLPHGRHAVTHLLRQLPVQGVDLW